MNVRGNWRNEKNEEKRIKRVDGDKFLFEYIKSRLPLETGEDLMNFVHLFCTENFFLIGKSMTLLQFLKTFPFFQRCQTKTF